MLININTSILLLCYILFYFIIAFLFIILKSNKNCTIKVAEKRKKQLQATNSSLMRTSLTISLLITWPLSNITGVVVVVVAAAIAVTTEPYFIESCRKQ